MAKEICASRSSARTLCALQGLIRRKSAQFEASVVSTNWRCKAARVCSLSQTSEASQRSRKCWRCGSERDSINGSRKAHNFGELCTIFVGIGRCSCWNKVSCKFTAYSGDALCGKRQPTSFESANSKSLTEKVKKAAKMAGFSRLFSPMSSNVLKVTAVDAVTMTGIDSEGFDMLADNRKLRIDFDTSISTVEAARATLVKLARR